MIRFAAAHAARTRPGRAPRQALCALAGLALLLAASGCAKKLATVDATYTRPEGILAADTVARMVMRPDYPIEYVEYFDRLNVGGPTPAETLFTTAHDTLASGQVRTGVFSIYASSPGSYAGTILDRTTANGYQVLRREANAGFRLFQDFTLTPARRWLDTQWEAYSFSDPSPSPFQPPVYVGRGLFSGAVTKVSPLAVGTLDSPFQLDTLRFNYQGQIAIQDLIEASDSTYAPPDSIFGLHWVPVPGASGYWIQIYQFTGNASEQIRSSLPAPAYLDKSRDFYFAFVPAPADSHHLGDPGIDLPGQRNIILTRRTIVNHQDYFARISAVDADGQVIAHSYGRPTRVPGGARNTWDVFWRGAIRIRPGPQLQTAPARIAAGR